MDLMNTGKINWNQFISRILKYLKIFNQIQANRNNLRLDNLREVRYSDKGKLRVKVDMYL